MKISLYVRVHIQTTPWRWSFGNLGIGFPISVSALTSASALDFFLPFEALSFAFWSFLWSKTSMVKSFSKTLASFPERVCCSLEQLFCSDVVSACFWRKELRYGRYLRSFKNTQGWKLLLVCLCISDKEPKLENTSWKFSVSFKTPLRNLVRFLASLQIIYCKPANPIKRGLFKKSYFLEQTMHVLDFLTESQNTEVSVTLLKSGCTTDALTVISKILGA